MSLWDNINKKRQRIKQGSGEKMRKKGDKGAPTPDQIKRAKGEDMEEGKINQMQVRRQDMAKLAGLYSKAMKAIPGSPEQKKIKKQIDQYRRELGMNESVNEIRQPLTVPKSLAKYVVYKKTGIGKIKQVAHLRAMPKGKELDRVLDKYDADGVIAMSKIQRNKMTVEAVSPAQQAAIAISKKEKGEKPEIKEATIVDYILAGIYVTGMMGGLAFIMGYTAYDVYQSDYRGRGLDKKLRQKFSDLKAKLKNKNYKPSKKDIETAKELGKEVKKKDPSAYKKAEVKVNKIKKDSKTKLKESRASEDDFKPHMMYDPKTGKGYKAEKPEDHERMKKMGYTHDKPEIKEGKDDLFQVNVKGEGGATVKAKSEKDAINKAFRKLGIATRFTRDRRYMTKVQVVPAESVEESRAYRDAMKGMKSRSATRGMATTKKDKDVEASDDDRKAANKNIIMQLRKAADLPTGANIEFERGKGKVSRAQAQAALARFNALAKPNDKEKFQKSIRSLSDIKKILGR